MKCNCKDWEPGMEKINAPIHLQQARSGFCFPDDHFIKMNYCPWCGEELWEVREEEKGELEKNYDFFESNLDVWRDDIAYKDKFIIIYKKEVKGIYDQFSSAIEFATENFPAGDFNVQQVIRSEDQKNIIEGTFSGSEVGKSHVILLVE